ncbi:Fc.00g030210.m01.CDS01 [Cosmosporella sp. VM-42]
MIMPLWKTSDSLDHRLPNNDDNSLLNRLGLKAVLVFCSSRALRGGPRLIVQVALFLCAILFLFRLLPERLGGSTYRSILPWGPSEPDPVGDLRIVVFGSPDLVGSAADVDQKRPTWTEHLCRELNCSSHLSFVSNGSRGLVSNTIYKNELNGLLNITAVSDIAEKPALDYNYIDEQYPIPLETPDLSIQIRQFLSMPPPKDPPRETLWIFTFGTWEIWNAAAMPKASGDAVVDASIAHIFEQIEFLYRMALDPSSIAFSDFWSNVTDTQIETLTAPDAPTKVDVRKLESFRVLIPHLFDITLTPGWQGRPMPSIPGSMAEQMRNAAELTARWNLQLQTHMDSWKSRGGAKPDSLKDEPDHLVEVVEKNTLLKYMPAALRPSLHPEEDGGDPDPIIYAPYPHRNAWHSNPAALILDAMTEEEMQRGGVWDSKGRGKLSINNTMRFLDVWTPCYKVIDDSTPQECENPNNHLFLDSFTVGPRAVAGLAKSAAKEVLDHLFLQNEEKPGWFYR